MNGPLSRWRPGTPPPHFGRLAHRLQSRWGEAIRSTNVCVATAKAVKVFGGHGGSLKHPAQASHDIHVSAVYLELLSRSPDDAATWLSEAKLAPFRRHQKLPDAALGDAPTELRLVLEFGNGYDADRLRDFHVDCQERSLPYEVW